MRKRMVGLAIGIAMLATMMLGGSVFAHGGGDNDRARAPGCSEWGNRISSLAQRGNLGQQIVSPRAQRGVWDDIVARFHNRRC